MVLINLYNIAKRQINKTPFKQKYNISFKTYELLKQYVSKRCWLTNRSLDNAYPRNTKFKVLKNVSQKDQCRHFTNYQINILKAKKGVLSQSIKANHHLFHKKAIF